MIDVIGRKIVKTRKPHVCFGCGREFPEGTEMERSCVVDDKLWTSYLCTTCQKITQSMKWGDEFGFGELRGTVLRIECKKPLACAMAK